MTGEPRTVIVGTAPDCDVRVNGDDYVSARHCRITRDAAGVVWLADLGSTNGTWVIRSGSLVRVTAPTRVEPGDVLRVGRSEVALWSRGRS